MSTTPTVYKPGQQCTTSRIYTVQHDYVHRDKHDVTVVAGEPFPPCNHCGQHPRYTLKYAAVHVRNHEHFKKAA